MTSPSFVVPLRDLEDSPKALSGQLSDDWIKRNLGDTEVVPAGTEDGRVSVVLTKTGQDVLVQGKLRATVEVPCARTLDPARYSLEAEVFLMLSPKGRIWGEPGPGGRTSGGGGAKKGRPPKTEGKHRARASEAEEERLLSNEDAASDHYEGEEVVLDDFFREFLLLEIPMVPLREDLRNVPFEANPSPPEGRPLDPRLSPLAELKARLEKKE